MPSVPSQTNCITQLLVKREKLLCPFSDALCKAFLRDSELEGSSLELRSPHNYIAFT